MELIPLTNRDQRGFNKCVPSSVPQAPRSDWFCEEADDLDDSAQFNRQLEEIVSSSRIVFRKVIVYSTTAASCKVIFCYLPAMRLLLLLTFLFSVLIETNSADSRISGISRQKRLHLVANETELLDKVAELMGQVREKDVGQELNKLNQSQLNVDGKNAPSFSVFPDIKTFDRIRVKVRREPLGFLWKKLYFEDFYDFDNLWPQFQTTNLELNVTTIVDSTTHPNDFYFQSAKNLKNSLPNLQSIKLGGGYHFESDNETADDLFNKLASTKNNIASIVESLKDQRLNVTFNNYTIDFVLPAKLVEKLENDLMRQQLSDIFVPSCIRWFDNVYILKFANQDVVTKLKVSIGTQLPKREFKPLCVNQTANYSVLGYDQTVNSTEDNDLLFHKNKTLFDSDQAECLKQVFEPNKTDIQAVDTLYLEDFIDVSNFQPQNELKHLNLTTSIVSFPSYSHEKFYETVVDNLKRTAPNLKSVGLFGTLRMYPNITSLYELRKELLDVKRSIEAASRAMHQTFENVTWFEAPMFVFAVDEEVLKRVQGSDLIKAIEVFNYSELEMDTGKIDIRFSTEAGVEHSLHILITALFPQGYSFH